MTIAVDNDLKKKVRVENRKNRRWLHIFWIIEKILLALVLSFIFLFPIYCVVSGNFIYYNMLTGRNSYFLVAMLTSGFGAMGLTLVFIVSFARKRLENVAIGERVDEIIDISDDKLFYTFRIKYQTLMDQINLVVLDLNNIKDIKYNEKLFEIDIEGIMVEKIIDLSSDVHEIEESEMVNSKLKLWDYFTPSLYELLKSKLK